MTAVPSSLFLEIAGWRDFWVWNSQEILPDSFQHSDIVPSSPLGKRPGVEAGVEAGIEAGVEAGVGAGK